MQAPGGKAHMLAMLELLCWLLPASRLKNAILQRFGHQISATARIGPTVVLGIRRAEIGENVQILPFNVFKGLSLARLDDDAVIASWNWITAATEFQQIDPQAGTLHIKHAGKIGSRNYLDCSGTIILGPYCFVGGNRTYLQTHEPDFERERQTAGRIEIGDHSLVHSCAVVLKGARLPDRSVLEANSLLMATKNNEERRRGVYAGSPATWQGETHGAWFERTDLVMAADIIEGPMGPVEDQTPSPSDRSQL